MKLTGDAVLPFREVDKFPMDVSYRSCACGACTFEVDTDPTFIADCPATIARKWMKPLDLPQFPSMPH